MRRREFVTLLGGAAATWPLSARAQQGPAGPAGSGSGGRRIGPTRPTGASGPQGLQGPPGTGGGTTIYVNAKDFGAKGNGRTDDTLAIQSAVDYAMSQGRCTVYLPEGTYKTSDTLHLGYGAGANSSGMSGVELRGAFRHELAVMDPNYTCVTKIVSTFKDRPIINIQGARGSAVKHLTVSGPTKITYPGSQPMHYRSNAANYVPAGAKDDKHAPFCGICVDAYNGEVPANPYPTPKYPSFVGPQPDAYHKAMSSDVTIDYCTAVNTLIGFMIQPSADGNGDFIKIVNCRAEFQKVAIAWGNSQARNNDLQNFVCSNIHTAFDGKTYGAGVGNISGNWNNICMGEVYRIVVGSPGWMVPCLVSNMYIEAGMLIGEGVSGFRFQNCRFFLQEAESSGGVLRAVLNQPVYKAASPTTFSDCYFSNRTIWSFEGDCRFENCEFQTSWTAGENELYPENMRKANSAFGHIYTQPGGLDGVFKKTRLYGIGYGHTQTEAGGFWFDGLSQYYLNNMYAIGQEGSWTGRYDMPSMHRSAYMNMSNARVVNNTLTFDPDWQHQDAFKPGDVLYAVNHSWWYVESQATAGPYTVTCKALTQWQLKDGVYSMLDPDPLGGGYANFVYYPIGMLDLDPADAPADGLFMVTTAGSPIITFVKGDGTPTNRPARLTLASKPLWYGKDARGVGNTVPFPQWTYVKSVDATSVTMRANALMSGWWAYGQGIKRVK